MYFIWRTLQDIRLLLSPTIRINLTPQITLRNDTIIKMYSPQVDDHLY